MCRFGVRTFGVVRLTTGVRPPYTKWVRPGLNQLLPVSFFLKRKPPNKTLFFLRKKDLHTKPPNLHFRSSEFKSLTPRISVTPQYMD